MSVKRVVMAGIGLLAGLTVCLVAYQRSPAAALGSNLQTTTQTAVEGGSATISAEAQVVPVRYVDLSFTVGGQVSEILVEAGTIVKVGDPLVRLEATDREIGVRQAAAVLSQAEAGLQSAQTQLEIARAGLTTAELGVAEARAQLALVQSAPLPQEIAVAENNLAAAEAKVAQAAASRDVALDVATTAQIRAAEAQVAMALAQKEALQNSYDNLIENDILGAQEEETRLQLEAAQARLEAAQAALDALNEGATEAQQRAASGGVAVAVAQRGTAESQLNLLLAGPKPEQVWSAEVNVEQAQAAVTQAEVVVEQAEAAVMQAEAAVAQARVGLEAAQAKLEQMTIRAAFDGTLAAINVELGEFVSPGVPVATIADFSQWLVETTDLTELDVVFIAVGDPVEVRLDAIPNEVLPGAITGIDTVSSLTRGDVTYAVTIRLDPAERLPIRWGMTAFIDINTE